MDRPGMPDSASIPGGASDPNAHTRRMHYLDRCCHGDLLPSLRPTDRIDSGTNGPQTKAWPLLLGVTVALK